MHSIQLPPGIKNDIQIASFALPSSTNQATHHAVFTGRHFSTHHSSCLRIRCGCWCDDQERANLTGAFISRSSRGHSCCSCWLWPQQEHRTINNISSAAAACWLLSFRLTHHFHRHPGSGWGATWNLEAAFANRSATPEYGECDRTTFDAIEEDEGRAGGVLCRSQELTFLFQFPESAEQR